MLFKFKSIDLFQLHGLPPVEGVDADRMHAAALTKVRQVTEEVLGVHYADGDLHLIELKVDATTPLQGHVIPTGDMFWLLFQLLGTGHIQQGKRSADIETDTYGGVICKEGRARYPSG